MYHPLSKAFKFSINNFVAFLLVNILNIKILLNKIDKDLAFLDLSLML